MHNVMRQIRRLVARPGTGGQSDEELLERFLTVHEEESFAALVRRHGPMVLGVCLRLLHHRQDAEDAFQATFLALVRKGHTIRQRGALSSWLYRVAFRVSLRLKARGDRRESPEVLGDVAIDADPAVNAGWRELRPVLDQEVQRLPIKYRTPMVLCYLEGKTYEEAAEQIGCPKGTVAIRLLRGREMLKNRLARRGLLAAAGCVTATGILPSASAAVPGALAGSTVTAAGAVSAGVALSQIVPAGVALLVEEGTRTLWTHKITLACATAICLGLSSFGIGGGALSIDPYLFTSTEAATGSPCLVAEVPPVPGMTRQDTPLARLCVVEFEVFPDNGLAQAAEPASPRATAPPRRRVPIPPEPPGAAHRMRAVELGVEAGREQPQKPRAFWLPDDSRTLVLLTNPAHTLAQHRATAGLALRDHLPDEDLLPDTPEPPRAIAPPAQVARGRNENNARTMTWTVRAVVFTEERRASLLGGLINVIYMVPTRYVAAERPNFSVQFN